MWDGETQTTASVDARSQPGLAELLELHRGGRIAEEFPQVARIVAGLSGRDLQRAGQLLVQLDRAEVLRHHPSTPVVSVAVTGHGTLSTLLPQLTGELARHGMLLHSFLADFDSYVFDLSDPDSALYTADAQLTLCVLDPTVVFDQLTPPWQPADVERTLRDWLTLVEQLISQFSATSQGTLVLNTLPLQRRYTAQLVDHRSRATLGAVWREANARLLRLAAEHPSVVVIDLEPWTSQGIPASDPRLSVYAKAHLSPELLAGYAREVGHLARHVAGLTRKCLVLDLDNTLWGGVLGEDGPDGIEVAETYRGEAFRAVQQVVRQIGSQGVLLAVVSKNEQELVQAALRDHPLMTLREDDFVRITANWRPKHDNLVDLAGALNLGVDSFVFVDDSAYECQLVGGELPQVAVVQVDNEPALHVETLLSDGWFDVRELAEEDRARPSRYREEATRGEFLRGFDSLTDYLRALDIRVRLSVPADTDVARLSQLTLRTNQFNLTTRRLQPEQVRAMIGDGSMLVLAIHAGDRFGDNGLVGAVFARRDRDAVHIDNFLLSCRVFSRGIEQACLASVLRHARETGTGAVFGSYRPSAKNAGVRDFYPRYGFVQVADDGTTVTFRHDLAEVPEVPDHVALTASLEGIRA